MQAKNVVANKHRDCKPSLREPHSTLCLSRFAVIAILTFPLILSLGSCTQTANTLSNRSTVSNSLPVKTVKDKKIYLKVTYATSYMYKIEHPMPLRMEAQKAADKHCGTVGISPDKWKTLSQFGKSAVLQKTVCYLETCNSIYHCMEKQ